MAATEFVVSDVKYSANKINGMTQFHVSRRLAPLVGILPIVTRGRKAGDVASPIPPEQVKEVMTEALRIIGEMKDEDVEYVLDACLKQVMRWDVPTQQWFSVWNSQARKPMFDDVNMMTMMGICFHVIKASLGPFTFASSTVPAL